MSGYLEATNEKEANPEQLREELREIESEIKAIVGPRKDNDWVEIPPNIDRDKLSGLLRERRYRLAMLFRKDPAGLEHFKKKNFQTVCTRKGQEFTGNISQRVSTEISTTIL